MGRANQRVVSIRQGFQVDLSHQIECFIDSLEHIRGVGKSSIARTRVIARELVELWGDIPVTSLTDKHIEEYIKHLRNKGNIPNTILTKMMSVTSFCNYLVRKGFLSVNPCDKVDRIRVPPSEPYVFTRDQIDILLALPDTRTEIGVRDWAIMVVLIGTGVRIGECLWLKVTDLDFRSEQIHLRKEITKNGHARTVPMAPMVKEALKKYLARREMMGSLEDPHVFVSVRDWQAKKSRKLTRAAVLYRLAQYVKKSGMEWNTRVSPHTFRHTFATQWIVNGGDTESLMKILGHRDQKMLAYYVNLAITDLQDKNDQFNPLNNISKSRVEELRKELNRFFRRPAREQEHQEVKLPESGFKPEFDMSKISRRWDDD